MITGFRAGEPAFVNGKEVLIVRQVLFNRPAYRVRALNARRGMLPEEWVVDGSYVSDDPTVIVGFVAPPITGEERETHRVNGGRARAAS